MKFVSHAVAKVNLMLNISGKDTSGYHEMQSVFLFLNEIFDVLEIDTNQEFSEFSGDIPEVDREVNSIKKAAEILKNNFNGRIPHIKVKKYLPIEGGVGGGSSDAACFVNSVLTIWGFSKFSKMKYIEVFKALGADAIVFLHKYFLDEAVLFLNGTGVTGVIEPIKITGLKDCYVLLVHDKTKIKTQKVFSNYKGNFLKKVSIDNGDIVNNLQKFENSLEQTILSLAPQLNEILVKLKLTNPKISGISGSGAVCFGLYGSYEEAQNAMYVMSSTCKELLFMLSKVQF